MARARPGDRYFVIGAAILLIVVTALMLWALASGPPRTAGGTATAPKLPPASASP